MDSPEIAPARGDTRKATRSAICSGLDSPPAGDDPKDLCHRSPHADVDRFWWRLWKTVPPNDHTATTLRRLDLTKQIQRTVGCGGHQLNQARRAPFH